MRYFSIFLLIPIVLFSQINNDIYMKGKAKADGTTIAAKLLVKTPMLKDDFITHITAKVNSDRVLDIRTSPFLYKNPVIKYKFKNTRKANLINYTLTRNDNETKEFLFNINRNSNTQIEQITTPKIKSKVLIHNNYKPWKAVTIEDGIQEVYGDIEKPITDKIKISDGKYSIDFDYLLAGCGYSTLHITSEVDLESFAIFTDMLPRSTIAKFEISKHNIIDYELKIKEGKISKNDKNQFINDFIIVVIGKDRNGKFYKETKKGKMLLNDDDCI